MFLCFESFLKMINKKIDLMAKPKKYFKITAERNVVTSDSDENYFDEFLVREDIFVEWARKMIHLGWKITCESDIMLQAEGNGTNPEIFHFIETEN